MKFDFAPETLEFIIELFQRTASFFKACHTSPEVIHLGGVTAIKVCSSNCILHQFGCGEANEITNKRGMHGIYQPPFNNCVVSTPSSKSRICLRRLR
jgi:hypothetical protein